MSGRRGMLIEKIGNNLGMLVGVLVVFLIIIGAVFTVGKAEGLDAGEEIEEVEESDYGRDNVTRLEVYNMEGKYEHMVYDYAPFYVGMTLSDDAATLNGATLEITLPKNIIDKTYLTPSSIESMERVEIVETEEHHVVTYYLKNLAGGVTVDIPINFRTTKGLVPEGYPLEVVATIKDREGLIIEESEPMIYTMRTIKARTFKAIQGYNSAYVDYDYFGFEDEDNKGYLTTDLDRTPSLPFYAGVYPKDRELIEVELIDELPEGAVFDAELTEGWEYDEETHTATITHKGRLIASDLFPFRAPPIYLKFPGFKIGERAVNKVYSKSTPNQKAEYEEIITGESDEAVIIRKIEIPEGLDGKKTTSANIIYDLEDNKTREFNWRLTLHNPADEITGMNLYDAKIIDRDLSEHLKYVGVYFFPVSGAQGDYKGIVGGMDIEVFYRDGTSEMVLDNENWKDYYNKTVYFPRQEDIVRVEIRSSEGSYIPPKDTQYLEIVTTFRKPEEKIVTGNESILRIENYADFEGRYEGLEDFKSTSKGSIRVGRPPINGLSMSKGDSISAAPTYVSGDKVDYTIFANLEGYYQKGRVIELTQIVDILPVGMEYEKGSSEIRLWRRNLIETDIKDGKTDPQIIHNYQGTGRTALVWELGDVEVVKTDMTQRAFLNLRYQTRVTSLLDPLKTENNAYMVWKNTDEVEPRKGGYSGPNGAVKDIYDLNRNGRTDDYILGASNKISYTPPYELIINKKSKGSLDRGYLLPPSIATSEGGEEVHFEFEIYNNSLSELTRATILDIFPKEGDKTVGTGAIEGTGGRISRGSTFGLTLVEPIEVPEEFRIYYTTDEIGDNITEITNNAGWEEELDDYTQATAFKVELKEGEVLESRYRKTFEATFKMPDNKDFKWEDKAVNSIGTSISTNLEFFESNLSTVRPNVYRVQGLLFNDRNKNGYKDEGESPIRNKEVRLLDELGNTVKDREGNYLVTVTDSKGNYRIDLTQEGNYRVGVGIERGEKVTIIPKNLRRDLAPNHLRGESIIATDIFTLNHLNYNVIRNGGFVSDEVNYTVEHINLATGREITDTEIGVVDGILQVRPREDLVGYKYNNYYTVNGGGFRSGDSYTIEQNSTDGDVTVRFYYNWEGVYETSKRMQGDDKGSPLPIDFYTNAGIHARRGSDGRIISSGMQVNTTGLVETQEAPIAIQSVEINIDLLDEDNNVLHSELKYVDDDTYLINDEYLNKVKINSYLGESSTVRRSYGVTPYITNLTEENSRKYNMSDAIGGTEGARRMAIEGTDVEFGVNEDSHYLGRWAYSETDLRFWIPHELLGLSTDLYDTSEVNNIEQVKVTIDTRVYNIMEHQYESRVGADGLEYYEYVGTELKQGYYQQDSEGNNTGVVRGNTGTIRQTTYLDVSEIKVGQYINSEGFNEENGEIKTVQNKVATEEFDDGGQTVVNATTVINREEERESAILEVNEEGNYETIPSEEQLIVNYYEEFGYIPHHVGDELATQQAVPVGGKFYYINPYEYTLMPSYTNTRLSELSGFHFDDPPRNHYEFLHEGKFAVSEVEYDSRGSGFYVSDVDEVEEYKSQFTPITEQNKNTMGEVLQTEKEFKNYNINRTSSYEEYRNSNESSGYIPTNEIQGDSGLSYRLPITYVHNIMEFVLEDVVAVGKDTGYPVKSNSETIEEDYKERYIEDNGQEPSETDKLVTMNKGSIYLIPTNKPNQTLEDEYRTRLFINNMGISQTSLVQDNTLSIGKYLYGRGDNTLYSGTRAQVDVGGSFETDQMLGKDLQPIELNYMNGTRLNIGEELADELLKVE